MTVELVKNETPWGFSVPRWELIPEHMRPGVQDYILHGLIGGDFLTAIVENDLKGAVDRADDVNRKRLADYVIFFFNYAPSECWGSKARVDAWVGHRGLAGWGG